jgi:hypothetical protein
MHRYALYGLAVDSAIELAAPAAAVSDVADCTVTLAGDGPIADVEWFHEWRFPRSEPSLRFGRTNESYVLRVPGVADFTVSADGRAVRMPCPGRSEIGAMQHWLADLVLPLAASRQRDLLLHAAAVELAGIGAVALAGESGRGKSSLAVALAARGASVLSDDCTAIDQTPESIVALPAYPGVRLWCAGQAAKARFVGPTVPFCNQQSPLTAIVVLSRRHHGNRLRARRISHHCAVVELMRHTFVMDIQDRAQLARVFDALTSLVACLPVVRLSLPDSRASLPEAAASTIELMQALVQERRAASAA